MSRVHVTLARRSLLGAGLALPALLSARAQGRGPVIGVSWSNFQEERWKTDEAAMQAAIRAAGGTYVSADAQSSPAKQLTDIDSLLARGARVTECSTSPSTTSRSAA